MKMEQSMDKISWKIVVVAVMCYVLWCIGLVVVYAQEHKHPPQDVAIHEQFYSTWLRPQLRAADGSRRHECCDKKDCYPTQFKNVGGTWFALRREDGVWWPIDETIMEHTQTDPEESPDGQNHVCMSEPVLGSSHVYCAVLGSGQ